MSGHDWSHVPPDSSYPPSSSQYRVPRSLFANGTPTIVEGLTRDVLGHDLNVSTYSTETFEQAGEYYAGSEHSTGVPVGKERAEDHNQGGLRR